MKIVPVNAATLPIYRDELAHLLTDAITHGASVGYDTLIPMKMPKVTSTVFVLLWLRVNGCCGLRAMSAASLAPCNSSFVRSRTAAIVRRW